MILSWPPQFGQCSRSISNTRLSRPAQLMRAGRPAMRVARLGRGELRFAAGLLWAMRHYQCSQLTGSVLSLAAFNTALAPMISKVRR